MALKPCKECGHEVSTSAKTCPHCGVGNPAPKEGVSALRLLAFVFLSALIIILLAYAVEESRREAPPSSASVSRTQPPPRSTRKARWAHSAVNVRGGRGTQYPVVAKLNRGERIEVDSLRQGWYVVYRAGNRVGYTSASVLQSQPLPPFEVVSFNWYKDGDFGGSGAVIWNVQVRNNTSEYVSAVQVEFTTYDANGNLIDTDWGYVTGLSPGGSGSHKGYATYSGREQKAGIRVVR